MNHSLSTSRYEKCPYTFKTASCSSSTALEAAQGFVPLFFNEICRGAPSAYQLGIWSHVPRGFIEYYRENYDFLFVFLKESRYPLREIIRMLPEAHPTIPLEKQRKNHNFLDNTSRYRLFSRFLSFYVSQLSIASCTVILKGSHADRAGSKVGTFSFAVKSIPDLLPALLVQERISCVSK